MALLGRGRRVEKSFYDILEVAPSATPEAVRAAYRHQMTLYHPDKVAALGAAVKGFKIGDRVRIEMRDTKRHSIFGAIEQEVQAP